MTRQSLFTIAPHAPFLPTLAAALDDGRLFPDWPRRNPFWLADITVILPTRRAVPALAAALADRFGGSTLLPDIRTFGGEAEDEEPFLPPFDMPAAPEVMPPLHRRLILSELIERWVETENGVPFADGGSGFASPPNPGEILRLADSLGGLIDEMHIEGVSPAQLRAIEPEDLGGQWQRTLKFLDIALGKWPDVLKERGRVDAAEARNARLRRQATTAAAVFGDRPVIAAGSTGSFAATAELIGAISRLPRGAVVLPGLDTSLGADAFAALLDDGNDPHGHPQFGLARLLRRLRTAPAHVEELAPAAAPRTALVRNAMALADDTTGWANGRAAMGEAAIRQATDGITLLVARTDEEQARAIAIAARHKLAEGSVGIISPDRNLARRIAAELGRFGIDIDDAAGTPLFQSRFGRLARQVLAAAATNLAPVDVMALLRNRNAGFGLGRAQVARAADAIEFGVLRGQRPPPGIAGLRAGLAANLSGDRKHVPRRLRPDDAALCERLLVRLEAALGPLTAILDSPAFSAVGFIAALDTALTAVIEDAGDGIPGQREFDRFAADMAASGHARPLLSAYGIDQALSSLMTGIAVRSPRAERAGIAIWGRLEARLHSPDCLILAGLNEGAWPEEADPGPWLSRGMRLAAGLPPPEWRHGLAAHDFEMAMGNNQVIAAMAERRGTGPATPSRYLQRLEAFVGPDVATPMRSRGDRWLAAARALDAAGEPVAAPKPMPAPPKSARPRRISVTDVDALIRSPYDLYAKYVLRLQALDPLGQEPGARERGQIIHGIFGRFVEEGHDPVAPGAEAVLLRLAGEEFAGLDWMAARRDLWMRRFSVAARGFLENERARQPLVASRHAERSGEREYVIHGEPFILSGRADRLDVLADGSLEIIDFKTGGIPSAGDMKTLFAPQLPLEALIARAGGFAGVPPGEASALTYVKIGAGPDPVDVIGFALDNGATIASVADAMEIRFQTQVAAFLLSDSPMPAALLPVVGRRYRGTYEHLSRTDEWMSVDEGEDGE